MSTATFTPAAPRPHARHRATYRAARRNSCRDRGQVWSSSWYVPQHRANYARGWPVLRHPPGRYPAGMLELQIAWRAMKERARERLKALRKMTLLGSR